MTLPYKMGTGLQGEPTLSDVLGSLRSDARVDEWDEYDDVLGDMPYSKAHKIAEAIRRQNSRLHGFLGDDDYATFINEEDE